MRKVILTICILLLLPIMGCEEFPQDFTLKLTQQDQGSLYTAELLYIDGKLNSGMQMAASPPIGHLCHYTGEWKYHNGTDCNISKVKQVPMTVEGVQDKIASGEYVSQKNGVSDIVFELIPKAD